MWACCKTGTDLPARPTYASQSLMYWSRDWLHCQAVVSSSLVKTKLQCLHPTFSTVAWQSLCCADAGKNDFTAGLEVIPDLEVPCPSDDPAVPDVLPPSPQPHGLSGPRSTEGIALMLWVFLVPWQPCYLHLLGNGYVHPHSRYAYIFLRVDVVLATHTACSLILVLLRLSKIRDFRPPHYIMLPLSGPVL